MTTLLIGASGLLGRNLQVNGEVYAPSSEELDITSNASQYFRECYHNGIRFDNIVLSAAYTNVARANVERDLVYQTNVLGVLNILNARHSWFRESRMVFISTDYVFDGATGMYKTTDKTSPVADNYYAYTKEVGERLMLCEEHVTVIRTSFCREDAWPYPIAFKDQFTSRDKVSIVAPMISTLVNDKSKLGIFHVGTHRKSVYELAISIDSSVKPGSRHDIKSVNIPYDTSLELSC